MDTRHQSISSLQTLKELSDLIKPTEPADISTLEKISVMVGWEMTEATLYSCIASTREKKPDNAMAYFMGGLKNQVPTIYDDLRNVSVRPWRPTE